MPFNVKISTTDGMYKDGLVSIYPKIKIQVQSKRTCQWDIRVSPNDNKVENDIFTIVTESNYINEITLDKNTFLQIGNNCVTVTVAPVGIGEEAVSERVEYVVYEGETAGAPECRLLVGDAEYAPGDAIELEVGVHDFVFSVVCDKAARCIPGSSDESFYVGITSNGSLGGGWRAYRGQIHALAAVNGELHFRVVTDDDEWSYYFFVRVRKASEDVSITLGEYDDVLFPDDVFKASFRIAGFDDIENSLSANIDDTSLDYACIDDNIVEVVVPCSGLSFGKHTVSLSIARRDSGDVLCSTSLQFTVCNLDVRLYEKASLEENWNLNMRIGLGLTYVLELGFDTDVSLEATLVNSVSGKKINGYPSGDRTRMLFYLDEQMIQLGPQELTLQLYRNRLIKEQEVIVTGWHVYTCRYTIEGNTVYESLSGPTNKLEFPMHFSISLYLQGVIPYTEAVEIGNGHYDQECFEYIDIDSMGITFDVQKNEVFAKKGIYSSSYLKYASDFFSKELRKISPTHKATRWKEQDGVWTKETYMPTPYLQANIIYSSKRTDYLPIPDYLEITYNDLQVKEYLKSYGVTTKSYSTN